MISRKVFRKKLSGEMQFQFFRMSTLFYSVLLITQNKVMVFQTINTNVLKCKKKKKHFIKGRHTYIFVVISTEP